MDKVKENPAYSRVNDAIVNTDDTAYKSFIEKRKSEKALENKVNELEKKIDLLLKKLGITDGTN
jgi:hypothetical protein